MNADLCGGSFEQAILLNVNRDQRRTWLGSADSGFGKQECDSRSFADAGGRNFRGAESGGAERQASRAARLPCGKVRAIRAQLWGIELTVPISGSGGMASRTRRTEPLKGKEIVR